MADVLTVVKHDGQVIWIPPVNYLIRCVHADSHTTHTNCSLKSV